MGYYTDFELTFEGNEVDEDVIAQDLTEISTYDWEDALILQAKWYDYHGDMIKLSQMYPNTLFRLQGDGEESGDQWVCYYQDGKSQMCRAEITFPPYDESKMK